MFRRWNTVAAAGLILTGFFTHSHALADVRLTIEGVRNAKGNVYVLVFDNAAAYDVIDYQKAVDFAEIKARRGTITHIFKALDAGPYAIMLFHDENGDGDFNMDGETPLEGYGLSGSRGADDLPEFDKASFGPGRVSVKVHYANQMR